MPALGQKTPGPLQTAGVPPYPAGSFLCDPPALKGKSLMAAGSVLAGMGESVTVTPRPLPGWEERGILLEQRP